MNFKNFSIVLLFGFVVFGCKTHPLPECITEKTMDLTIRWGENDKKNKLLKGFMINGTGQIFSFYYHDTTNKNDLIVPKDKYKEIGYIDSKWFCEITNKIQKTILMTQVSNEPGELNEFLEFSNPSVHNFYRGQWVRKFKTANSSLFREVYDSLQVYKLKKKD